MRVEGAVGAGLAVRQHRRCYSGYLGFQGARRGRITQPSRRCGAGEGSGSSAIVVGGSGGSGMWVVALERCGCCSRPPAPM